MTLLLGVDTGGTYTDAVLLRGEEAVVASAKSLTTRGDLALGVGRAVREVLARAGARPADVSLAALSTTLATNALVEGQGGRVALAYIGFQAADLTRAALVEALKGDPAVVLGGGHDHAGSEAVALDVTGLEEFALAQAGRVSAFAVASQFATRNPGHELEAARILTARTGLPVSCSHQLSARLNGPKRALTAVLNARLLGMIDALIGRAGDVLGEIGITAPLMVVRGDGALMSAEQARARPIETILSGPAASIVGARWLTGAGDALVSDIGGTTTDVALLRGGRPAIDPAGAQVGGHRTMVEAVAMRTHGLGGDSQVHVVSEGLAGGVRLGPKRVVPVALIARESGAEIHDALDEQLRTATVGEYDGRFVRAVPGAQATGSDARELALLERMGDRARPLGAVLRNRVEQGALNRLVGRGTVQLAGVTPSDAAHVLGMQEGWDTAAAEKALAIMARRRTGSGEPLAGDARALARMIVDQVTDQTVLTLLETAFAEEDSIFHGTPETLARHALLQAALHGHRGLLALDARLNVDVVGLGASAPSYYPAVGERLGCKMLLPEHAGVANAIGAVVGRITVRRTGVVTSPSQGRYRVHLESGPEDFASAESALERLEATMRAAAIEGAEAAGAVGIQVRIVRDVQSAEIEAQRVFVEATLTAEASGRARVAGEA